jgi:hypothetical protein
VERMGRWIDFENDYKTLDPTFMESVWWVFAQMYAKGLVYTGFKARVASHSAAPVPSPLARAWCSPGGGRTHACTAGHAVLDGLCDAAVQL